jgi:hypothetical protein
MSRRLVSLAWQPRPGRTEIDDLGFWLAAGI